MDVVLFHAVQTEPPAPRKFNAKIPRDLETICLKALAKRPEDRYPNCQALADDLRRWLEDEPILARRFKWRERPVLWVRRNPVVASLTAGLAAALLLGAVVSGYFAVQSEIHERDALNQAKQAKANEQLAREQKDRADEKAREALKNAKAAEGQKELARRHLYVTRMQLAHRHWQEAHIPQMLDLLNAERPQDGQEDIRSFEWGYLWRLSQSELPPLKGHSNSVSSVAISADGKRIVSGDYNYMVKVWDAATGKETLSLKGHTGIVGSVAINADGKRIVSGSWDQTVKVWDAASGQDLLTLKGHAGNVRSVAFSPDGKRIVSGSSDGTVKVWDAATGQEALTLKGHAFWVISVAFRPDGKRIVSGSSDKTVKVWDAATGQETLTLKGHNAYITSVAISADGKRHRQRRR
jgi:hypothetical protein